MRKLAEIPAEHDININTRWAYLLEHMTKADVEETIAELSKYPGYAEGGKDFLYGYAVNRTIGKILGGGYCDELLRIENDMAKHLGYTFDTA